MSNLQSGASESQLIELFNTIKFPVVGAGGGFAPIGTENYVDGSIAPQGWLICDGSTKNIADYPELAAYIASHHGSTNYYGGDGVTTFAVPTRSGMPTSGVNTPDEHIVGEWRETIDGVLKKKPVYERTFVKTETNPSGNWVIVGTISDGELLVGYDGSVRYPDTGQRPFVYVRNTNHFFAPVFNADKEVSFYVSGVDSGTYTFNIVVRYTKTTDSWTLPTPGHSADGNGVFCVKATVSGDANGEVYSTEETLCGTWIDGKSLFVKVFTGLNAQIPTNNWNDTVVSISDLNIDTLVGCICLRNSGGSRSDAIYIPQEIGSSDGYINIYGNNRARTINTVIICYTKTS